MFNEKSLECYANEISLESSTFLDILLKKLADFMKNHISITLKFVFKLMFLSIRYPILSPYSGCNLALLFYDTKHTTISNSA